MADPGAPLRTYYTVTTDNRRWERFVHRPSDIFVCTPPKCGTTWTQTIVASLLWPGEKPPAPVMSLSPWLEAQFHDLDEVLETYAAQTHRRFIKSHTPADGIPIFGDASYIFVARDGRDAFMSLCNHQEAFKNDVRMSLNARALEDGVAPMPDWDGDVHGFFERWLATGALFGHVASFWELRERKNVLLVHFNDLKRDLDAEMRRIAEFLGSQVPASQWPAVVSRCTFEAMKARADEIGSFWNFEGGAQSFLFKGTNGRWKDVLTPAELDAYDRRVRESLPTDAVKWLAEGRGASPTQGGELD